MDRTGINRVLHPPGVLPQQAERLDTSLPLAPDEIGIDVEQLNIDSASWKQLREANDDDPQKMADAIETIVRERGKMHNPVTGSGGMLIGTVAALGEHRQTPPIGTRIASLVSLTLTPLVLEAITSLEVNSEKVGVAGRAILFGSGIYHELPDDLPDATVLGVLDVCGAPAWVAASVTPGMRVVVLGAGGKSGLLACAQAQVSLDGTGQLLGLCWPPATAEGPRALDVETRDVDCTQPVAVAEAVDDYLEGERADLVVVCTNVPGCEAGAILACDDDGEVLFFSMATSFTTAALTAEGLGRACRMTIGNGYVPGHAELALTLVRSSPELLDRFSG